MIAEYILPNDEVCTLPPSVQSSRELTMGQTEQDRLDLQHQMLLIMLDGRLQLAPIKPDLQYVLDVGTGTGIWAIEFGRLSHASNV
jgi:hypothetical protein